jgi:hypothetical protein
MKTISKILFIVLLYCVSFQANADNLSAEKINKINKMLELIHVEQALKIGIKTCTDATLSSDYSPEKIVARNGKYYGFTANSKNWQSVKRLFEKFAVASCSYIDLDELKSLYIDFYVSRVSERYLDAWLAFMQSAAGQSFLANQDSLIKHMGSMYAQKSLKANSKAQKKLEAELAALKKE